MEINGVLTPFPFDCTVTYPMHFLSVDTPVNVYLKLPVTEISKIDDQRSVSNIS